VSHTPKEATVQFPKRSDVKPQEQSIEKYVPKRAVNDPVKLGSQTIQAVDIIGQMATSNIEDVITEIEKGCDDICSELRALADGIRISTIEASSRIASYCDRVNGLVMGIRKVQDVINEPRTVEGKVSKTIVAETEERLRTMDDSTVHDE
jgi:hypothetical protein